jgi:ribosomal protein S27AE
MNMEKRSCLERARIQLADGKSESLRYACLELRYCIESIAYEKLRLYAKQIPAAVLDVWQPRRVIDMLEEYDPLANKNYTLRIRSEIPDGGRDKLVFSGEHRTLSPIILKKHYNKLGNYLHVPTPAQAKKEKASSDAELRKYLEELVSLIEPICNNILDANIAEVVNFECQQCGQPIFRNKASVVKNSFVTCLAECCQAQHEAYEADGKYFIRLRQAEFLCPDCNTTNYVALHQMAEGARLTCVECKSQYIVDRTLCANVSETLPTQ